MLTSGLDAKRVERIEELEAYISHCQSPSETAANLLRALYCFKEALFALWQGRSNSIEWLCEANLWDEKACQYSPEVLAEFAFLARDRAREAGPLLDIPALVVICWCGGMNDFCLQENTYARILQALQSDQGIQGWSGWRTRFMELLANSYCYQGRWSDGLRELRAIEDVNGKMFRDTTYGIGVCLNNLGDDAGAERELLRYTSTAAIDSFKMPHAHYQLAQFDLIRGDLASMKMRLSMARAAEEHRNPLFYPVEKNFPLKDMMISTFRVRSRQQTAGTPAAPSQEVVCGHCGESPLKLLPCTCRRVFYCDKECQKADWKLHKSTCSAKVRSKRGQ